MKNARPITFKQFSLLPLEQRQKQFKYFHQKNPKTIPVLLSCTTIDMPELKNCKFLIREEDPFMSITEQLRNHIRKNCHLKPEEQLFFYVKSKILNPNQKAKELYEKVRKDYSDGWLIITYTKENVFGSF